MSKPCVVCGKPVPIKPRSPKNKITCSDTCSEERRRQARNKWWERNKQKYKSNGKRGPKNYALTEYKFEACPFESGQVQQAPFGGMM